MKTNRFYLVLIAIAFLLTGVLFLNAQVPISAGGQWPVSGQNLNDWRSQPAEHTISPTNVGMLAPKWVFTTGGDVSATPTVAGEAVYFPDWAGNIYAVNKNTGQQIWSAQISTYTGVSGDLVRSSPAAFGDELIFGDNQGNIGLGSGAYLDRSCGELPLEELAPWAGSNGERQPTESASTWPSRIAPVLLISCRPDRRLPGAPGALSIQPRAKSSGRPPIPHRAHSIPVP